MRDRASRHRRRSENSHGFSRDGLSRENSSAFPQVRGFSRELASAPYILTILRDSHRRSPYLNCNILAVLTHSHVTGHILTARETFRSLARKTENRENTKRIAATVGKFR